MGLGENGLVGPQLENDWYKFFVKIWKKIHVVAYYVI